MKKTQINSKGLLYPKTKNYFQKVFVRRIFGKRLYKYFKVLKILFLYKIGKNFEISDFLKKIIVNNFVIFDIGANLGQYSVRLTKYAAKGKIISIEPVFENFKYLLKIKNKYKLDNCEFCNFAISDYVGKGTLYIPVIDHGIELDTRATIDKNNYYFDYENYITQDVNVTTVSSLFESLNLERIDIIKSDTEGNDEKVILGSIDLIKKYLPIILVEDSYKEDWLDYIYKIGYIPFYVNKQLLLKNACEIKGTDKNVFFDLLVLIHNSKLINFNKYLA